MVWAAFCPSRSLPSKVEVFILTNALHDLADPLAELRSMRDQLEPESGAIVVHELGTKNPTLEALSAGESMDLFLSAATIGMCGPGAMVGRAYGKPCSSASLGTRDGKAIIFFGPVRPVVPFPGRARNTIFNFRPVWARENLFSSMF